MTSSSSSPSAAATIAGDGAASSEPASPPEPPFVISRLPAGLSYGEIEANPKAQPFASVHSAAALAKSQRGTSTAKFNAIAAAVDGGRAAADENNNISNISNNSNNSNSNCCAQNSNRQDERDGETDSGNRLFHVLHTGSFVRIATLPGRMYWLAQNCASHRTPDWKLHIAAPLSAVPIVWNICLCPVFLESCPALATIGLKAVLSAEKNTDGSYSTTVANEERWRTQRGRELTVYLFQDDPAYHQDEQQEEDDEAGATRSTIDDARRRELWSVDDPDVAEHWHAMMQHSSAQFTGGDLVAFILRVQERLDFFNVEAPGCADGDLPLTRSVSLRNEAFVSPSEMGDRQDSDDETNADIPVYPLNQWSWNAARHELPPAIVAAVEYFRKAGQNNKGGGDGGCCSCRF